MNKVLTKCILSHRRDAGATTFYRSNTLRKNVVSFDVLFQDSDAEREKELLLLLTRFGLRGRVCLVFLFGFVGIWLCFRVGLAWIDFI